MKQEASVENPITKERVQGFVLAAGLAIVGLWFTGVMVSASWAQRHAKKEAAQAVLDYRADACAQAYASAPGRTADEIKKMQESYGYQRGEALQKAGFAVKDDELAAACGNALERMTHEQVSDALKKQAAEVKK